MDGHGSNFDCHRGGHVHDSGRPENGGESDRLVSPPPVKAPNHGRCSPPSPPPRPKNKPGTDSASLPSALSVRSRSNGVSGVRSQLSDLVTISCDVCTSDGVVSPARDEVSARNPEVGGPVCSGVTAVTGIESVGAIPTDVQGLAALQPAHRSRSDDALNLESLSSNDGSSAVMADSSLDVSTSCGAPTVMSSSATVDRPRSSSPVEQLQSHERHVADDSSDACFQHPQATSPARDCVVDGKFASGLLRTEVAASLEPVCSSADGGPADNLGDPAPGDAKFQMICKQNFTILLFF